MGRPSVAIGITTYKRPEGLCRLIESLERLRFAEVAPRVRILVVDNDADKTAAAVCEPLSTRIQWPLLYDVEPRPGISHGRNRVVVRARDEDDFLAFVDDDETVDPEWLDELLRVQRKYDADVVTGPALPQFPPEAPAWAKESRFFDPKRYATGAQLDHAYTNNVLLSARIFQEQQPIFDERFGLTGGGDLHAFTRLSRAGCRIVWADEAIVHDHLPMSRLTRRWVLRRAYRNGNTHGIICRMLDGWSVESARFLGKALRILLRAAVLLPPGLIFRRQHVFKHVRQVVYGSGMLTGWLKFRFKEYKRIHGR